MFTHLPIRIRPYIADCISINWCVGGCCCCCCNGCGPRWRPSSDCKPGFESHRASNTSMLQISCRPAARKQQRHLVNGETRQNDQRASESPRPTVPGRTGSLNGCSARVMAALCRSRFRGLGNVNINLLYELFTNRYIKHSANSAAGLDEHTR